LEVGTFFGHIVSQNKALITQSEFHFVGAYMTWNEHNYSCDVKAYLKDGKSILRSHAFWFVTYAVFHIQQPYGIH
jgi:hypothetical protein